MSFHLDPQPDNVDTGVNIFGMVRPLDVSKRAFLALLGMRGHSRCGDGR